MQVQDVDRTNRDQDNGFAISPSMSTQHVITRLEQKEFVARLNVTDEEIEAIANFPQGSPEWLKARYGRLTGSIIGAAVGHNPFCSHSQLLENILWNTFTGNEATRYGSANESRAAAVFATYKKKQDDTFELTHANLLIHKRYGFLAYSPDGLFQERNGMRGLLEIKCPFKKKLYPKISLFYYDQIQLGLYLTQRSFCDFVVFTPTQTSLERFDYNKDYVEQFLLPNALQFYFQKLVPLLIAKERNLLPEGDCAIPSNVLVEKYSVSFHA
jgi:putative phage-type endonuclease